MAGFIYHRLRMQFTTPTINLWIGDTTDDYIRFLKNLNEYLNKELCFIHDGVNKYPRAWLGDVKIGFSHYKSEEEAKEAWNRRKKRIYWDRIYVIVYARNGIKKEDYFALQNLNFQNIAVVAASDCEGFKTDSLFFDNEEQAWITKVNGIRIFERDFDYISFLKKRNRNIERRII